MNGDTLIEQLKQSQSLLLALVQDVDEIAFKTQFHPDLSPIGWHLGHCVYTECYWLHEQLRGDNSVTSHLADLYTPPRTPKNKRGRLLPHKDSLLGWAREIQAFNLNYLRNVPPELRAHELLKDDYLLHFLIQHNSQHYETMLMVLSRKALDEHRDSPVIDSPLQASRLCNESVSIPAGHYRIGGDFPTARDNELPKQHAELGSFSISKFPVTNAEFLAFMEGHAYRNPQLWTDESRQWKERHHIRHPDHWRQNDSGHWYAVGLNGSYELVDNEPVSGLSHYEASAFANWAAGQLPHEYQWEAACRAGMLQKTGRVWEWCRNCFQPYDGFRAFPYAEYSQPWFDKRHFTLRGGSLYTRPAVRRPGFRNFYAADKRHIFAGLRLVF